MALTSIRGNHNTTLLLNQLKQAEDQYPELSKEEERAMIEKYRNDRDKLNYLLFMHNIKFIFNAAKKYQLKTVDFDGMVQDGMIGLGEACQRFDIDRGTKFITYAVPWVRKYILANFYGKNIEVEKNSISLQTPNEFAKSKSNSGKSCTLEDSVNELLDPSLFEENTSDKEISAHEKEDLCADLFDRIEQEGNLSANEIAAFKDVVMNQEKIRTVASKYGMTLSALTELKNNLLAKFKDILVNQYEIDSYADVSLTA